MAEERNSEGKATWIVVGMAILAGLVVVGDKLLGSGVFDEWPTVAALVGSLGTIAKVVGDYTKSRPAKHHAMAVAKADAESP